MKSFAFGILLPSLATMAVATPSAATSTPLTTTAHPVERSAAAGDTPPSAVEDFAYPNAEQIFKEKGLKLLKGDGHIVLTDCSADNWRINVEANKGFDTVNYCFKVTGKKGDLALEVPDVTGIWTDNQVVHATLSSEGKTKTVGTPDGPNKLTGVGVGDITSGAKRAILIELSVNH